ncbi:hypothetical protein TcG_04555 [Trypanosoma cruzi]|nr:hypothetical protein TcG_04555 [Trypanosoma cruzi]
MKDAQVSSTSSEVAGKPVTASGFFRSSGPQQCVLPNLKANGTGISGRSTCSAMAFAYEGVLHVNNPTWTDHACGAELRAHPMQKFTQVRASCNDAIPHVMPPLRIIIIESVLRCKNTSTTCCPGTLSGKTAAPGEQRVINVK